MLGTRKKEKKTPQIHLKLEVRFDLREIQMIEILICHGVKNQPLKLPETCFGHLEIFFKQIET